MEGTKISAWKARLAGSTPTFIAALLFSALVAFCLRLAWNPGLGNYIEYVPIGGVFAAFVWDRAFPSFSRNSRAVTSDVVVITLALMRVFVPPLPLISGHSLMSAYAALTARQWPLRTISLVVLAQVMYVKLFVSEGWLSMIGGFGAAIVLAWLRGWGKSKPL
jgi:hypothetical protein